MKNFDSRLEAQIEDMIEQHISEKMDEEIEKRVEQFRKDLKGKKDQYLGEVLRSIKMYAEHDLGVVNFRIVFENVVKVEK